MELLNEVFTNQVVQALLVLRISKDWQEDILANVVQVFEDGLVDFHEDNLLVDAGWEAAFVRVLLLAGFDDDDCFGSLDLSW
jgi:hypothetical protein